MHYVAASAQMWPSCVVTHEEIEYLVGVDEEGIIRFIETSDTDFLSPEGLRVGSTVSDARAVGGAEPIGERGWGHYSQLPSGWLARYPGIEATGLPTDAKIASFFKR